MSSDVKYVEANGLRFAYLEEGTGPLVLLIHGFPDTAHTWDDVRPALASWGYRAVSPFTRGYAPTAVPEVEDYGADTLGQDIVALIDALGDGQPVILVGHDWGASGAYAAAAQEPDKIRFLVTVAIPHPASITPTPRLIWGARHFFSLSRKNSAKKTRKNDFALIDTLVRRWAPTWDVPADEMKYVKETFADPRCLDAALGYYRALGRKLPAGHRKKISVPTVAIGGEDDPVLKPKAYAKAASRFTGDYSTVIMPGGHFLHREHPARFLEELRAVLPPA